jgi:hypothetical protein
MASLERPRTLFAASALLLSACASTAAERPYSSADERSADPATESAAARYDQGGQGTADAPEISRSEGKPGGIVVLWPRIVLPKGGPPKPDPETRAIAGKLQARLAEIARRAAPGAEIDVRPEPERVCPKKGCKAASLGILLARANNGCVAVALLSKPAVSPARLVAWKGVVELSSDSVPFRSPPEGAVNATDYQPCPKIADDPAEDAAIEAAIRELRGN